MADPTDDGDGTEPEPSGDQGQQNWRRDLERRAREGDAARAEAAELRQQLALHEAGLGALSSKQAKALYAAHDGKVTAEALKATADELGFIPKTEPVAETPQPEPKSEPEPASQPQPDEGLDAIGRIGAATTSESQPEPVSRDQELQAQLKAAKSQDEAWAIIENAGMAKVR